MISEILISLLASAVLITIVIFAYRGIKGYYPGSKLIVQEPPSSTETVDDTHAKFLFFYTNWCGWSKKAMPIWSSFRQQLKNSPKQYNGKTILFEEVNCEDNKGKCAVYTVEGYPTFKLQTADKVYEFVGSPSSSAFEAFFNSALKSSS